MNKFVLTTAVLATLLLTACDKKETYTADFLLQNDDVRATVLAECKANKQTDENCKNANDAENRKKLEKIRKARYK